MGFAADLKRLCDAAGDKAEHVVRNAALDLGGQMIDRSPVDTGRFKSNWMTGIGVMDAGTTSTYDANGEQARRKLVAEVAGWKPGQTIWIVNSLPYAYRLEHGWSEQAPAGMVRLAVQNYAEAVAKAARELK
ncbi:HK97 gp10 family phage protein [Comamonas terrigena]|uniref:HK97 gp10 family phage protein n=1 Tax=Comamonas terrigena TaxID=32013 RepID=UPI00289CD83C|nr:HK97 gp10 family phage protein [Comamonas terrigena]